MDRPRPMENSRLLELQLEHTSVLTRLREQLKVPEELISAALNADEKTYLAAEDAIINWACAQWSVNADDALEVLNGKANLPQQA